MQRCRSQQREAISVPGTQGGAVSARHPTVKAEWVQNPAIQLTVRSTMEDLDGTVEVRVQGDGACSFTGTFVPEGESRSDQRIEVQFLVTVRGVPVAVAPGACHASMGSDQYSDSEQERIVRFALDEMQDLGSLMRQIALRRATLD